MTDMHDSVRASSTAPPGPAPHSVALEDLRVFCEVARRGSFTGAADACGYTQSGVSRRIAALERASGGPLFRRRARGVQPTPAGEVLHVHALAILDALAAAVDAVRAVRDGTGGRLRVGSFATASAALVPAAVAELRRAAHGIETTVTEALSWELAAALRAGLLDVAVVSDYPSGDPPLDGVELEHLCDDPMMVALPPDHPLACAPAVDLADLAGDVWIEAGRLAADATTLQAAAARAGFVPRTDVIVPGWTAKQGFVAAGLGVTLVPRLAAGAMRPDIVLRPLRDSLARRRVFVARPAAAPPLAAAERFVGVLRTTASALTGGAGAGDA
jgi:DNA-binding transcriptional LysR family regulator